MKRIKEHIPKISAIGFITIFLIIYTLSLTHEPPEKNIENLKKYELNKNIKINNLTIIKQTTINENSFITFKNNKNKTIKTMIFNLNTELEKSHKYNIYGKTTIYNNKTEIIVNKIKISDKIKN